MEKETPYIKDQVNRFTELMQICNDTNKPNAKAREEMQNLLRTNKGCKEVMERQEGMYAVAIRRRIDSMSSSDTFKEVMHVKCAQLREELGYSSANQLERLAIEQIVLCWFNHHLTEMKHANMLSQSHTTESGIYWEKRLSFSSRRYERALELLSKMRKMNLVVQVNNATNQIVNSGK